MTQSFLKKVAIPRRSITCSKTGERLTPSSEYLSIIRDGQKEGELTREDISLSWWSENGDDAQLKEVKSFWKGKVPDRKNRIDEPQEFYDKALYLLYECLKGDDLQSDLKAFILTLFLARKKRLTFKQEMEHEGRRLYLYEVNETEDILTVTVLRPDQTDVEKVKGELTEAIGALS